jgi:hypothetical protein
MAETGLGLELWLGADAGPWTGWGFPGRGSTNEDGVDLVRAVKPCACGAPLRGFGA